VWLRAAGAEEIVRPWRLIGRFWAVPRLRQLPTAAVLFGLYIVQSLLKALLHLSLSITK